MRIQWKIASGIGREEKSAEFIFVWAESKHQRRNRKEKVYN